MTRLLLLCCAPQALIAMDFSVMAVVVTTAAGETGLGQDGVPLVFAAYSLPFGCLLLPSGRLTDGWGADRTLAAGLGLFGIGAAAVAVAPAAAVLLIARCCQGAGAAVMAPAGLALLTRCHPDPSERRRALTWYAASISAGFVAGSLVAGVVAAAWSWRIAVAVPAAIALSLGTAASARRGPAPRLARSDIDARSAVLLASAVAAIAVTLDLAGDGAPWPLLVAGAGVAVAMGARTRASLRSAPQPLVPRALAHAQAFRSIVLAGSLVTTSGVAATVLLTMYLQDLRGFGALRTGALLAAFGAMTLAGRWAAQRLASRGGAHVLSLGLVCQGSFIAAIAVASASGPSVVTLAALLAGFGLGHVIANAGAAMGVAETRDDLHGIAGAVVGTGQYLGAGAGPLLVSAIGGGGTDLESFAVGMAAAALLALGGAVTALLRPGRGRPPISRRRR